MQWQGYCLSYTSVGKPRWTADLGHVAGAKSFQGPAHLSLPGFMPGRPPFLRATDAKRTAGCQVVADGRARYRHWERPTGGGFISISPCGAKSYGFSEHRSEQPPDSSGGLLAVLMSLISVSGLTLHIAAKLLLFEDIPGTPDWLKSCWEQTLCGGLVQFIK